MLKKMFWLMLLSFILIAPNLAQKLESPKLTPKPLTEKQSVLLKEGVKLHDSGQFDEAIKRYEAILSENPDSPAAMYESAYSSYAAGNLNKALEYGYKAANYKSDALPRIYDLIGNVLDDRSEVRKAIEIYQFGIKQFPLDYLLNFNLGVALARQGNQKEARESLKRSASLNPQHPGSQLVLAKTFSQNNYRVPALLAASRFFILEPNTKRTEGALEIIFEVLQGGVKKGNSPNEISIFANLNSPKDEGDFGAAEMSLGLSKAAGMTEGEKDKTEAELLAGQITVVIEVLSESKNKDGSKFVWSYYVPYFEEMKRREFVETFANMLRLQKGDQKSRKWLAANQDQLAALIKWSESYQFPAAK